MYQTRSKIYNETTPIEQILYGQFIKYTSLRRMVEVEFSGSSATELNVFIDLNQMLLKIYRYLRIDNYYSATAIMINYGIHFRNYFRTRHNVNADVIFVYSPNMSTNNTQFVHTYNKSYIDRMRSNTKILTMVNNNLKLLKIICPYLPGLYYKDGTVEPGVIIKNLIDTSFHNGRPNVIISDSDYMLQLPPIISKDTVVFRKKFTLSGEDISYSYNRFTAMDTYVYGIKKVSPEYVIPVDIPRRFICILMVLSGLPKRNIKSVFDVKRALDILKYIPVNLYGSTEAMYDCIQQYMMGHKWKTKIKYDEFTDRFHALDIYYQQKMYRMMPESMDDSFLTRLSDPDAVKAINNKYFKEIPINLESL